ncbi:hypothetical protein Tco_1303668 [Tanacetum coccineum]
MFLDLQKAKDAQAKEIVALKKRIQRLERRKMSRPIGLKRLRKVGMSRRVESFEDQESLGAPKDASKHGRSIKDINADVDASLVDESQKKQNDDLMFDSGSKKPDDSTAGEAVTTVSIDDSAVPTTIEEITLAQTLIQIKTAKPKVEKRGVDRCRKKHKTVLELMEKKKKHFVLSRAQERGNRSSTKALKENSMSTYLRTWESKEKKEEGREETAKGSRKKMLGRKRAGKEQHKESSKKQKVEEEKESEEVDEVELKKLLVIKKDEDIAIDAIPLATKLPVIVDYKLLKEGIEDLEALWRIVKAKHADTKLENEFERVLYGDLKVMFEPDIKSERCWICYKDAARIVCGVWCSARMLADVVAELETRWWKIEYKLKCFAVVKDLQTVWRTYLLSSG